MAKITRNEFKTWLESKSAKTKVGTKRFGDSPFLRFLRAKNVEIEELPKWARDFSETVQSRNANSISAKSALALLD